MIGLYASNVSHREASERRWDPRTNVSLNWLGVGPLFLHEAARLRGPLPYAPDPILTQVRRSRRHASMG